MPNFRSNEDLCKLDKQYLNDLLCKLGPFCPQHSKTFDISLAFLWVTIAELSMLKQVQFFLAHPVHIPQEGRVDLGSWSYIEIVHLSANSRQSK